MDVLRKETWNVQNPALGAILQWRFAIGYEEGSKTRNPVPIPLLFIVLPMILHEETESIIESTKRSSGLRALAGKFAKSDVSKIDLIYAIQERADRMKTLSTESLKQALASKLISIDPNCGAIVPLTVTRPRVGIPSPVSKMFKNAEKLGFWCGEVSLHEVAVTLKIGF